MSEPGDGDETLASDTVLGSDETVRADSDRPSSSASAVVRSGRPSIPPRERLGRYTIVGLLGRGGVGQVFEAEDPELGRRVAIKVLREDRGGSPTLLREAQALAKLVHPNVVAVYDVGTDGNDVFIVMQLVDGLSIDRWLRRRATTLGMAAATPITVLSAYRQAGLGLAAAHAAGLVHCDFKPANVFVDREGAVKVGDFGLARNAGETGQIAGTPAYMAPEQFGGVATEKSDQYSFCVALWEALAGERLFEDSTLEDAKAHLPDRSKKPLARGNRISTRVVRALERGLSADPSQRFPTMHALLAELSPRNWKPFAIAGGAVAIAAGITISLVATRGARRDTIVGPPRLDAAKQVELTHYKRTACAYSPAFTASGKLAYDRTERDAVDLFTLPITGGTPRQLTTVPETWEWRASRGRTPNEIIHLVHSPNSRDRAAIMARDIDTGIETKLVDVYARDAAIVGDTIYYIPFGQSEIRTQKAGVDGVFLDVAPRLLQQLTVSPRGDWLALVAIEPGKSKQLCLVEIATQHLECLGNTLDARPAFGTDGRNVYYATGGGIRRRELATRLDESLLAKAYASGGIAVAPDGSGLVYSSCDTQGQIVEAAPNTPVVIDDAYAREPAVGPNNIVVWSRIVDGGRVLVARGADGKEVQLTRADFGTARGPIVSPDGKRVVFYATGKKHPGIHLVDLEPGLFPTQLTDSPRDLLPSWVSNEEVAFNRADDSNIPSAYVVSITGGAPRRIGLPARSVHGARNGELLVSAGDLMVWVDPKTGAERPGPPRPASITFVRLSPSSKWIVYDAGRSGHDIWRASLDPPGKLEHVMTTATGQTGSTLAITDDGRVLMAPVTWSGDLTYVPAAPGTKL